MKAQVTVDTAFSEASYLRMRSEAGTQLVHSAHDIVAKVRAGTPGPYVIVIPDLPAAEGVPDRIIASARALGVDVQVV